MQPQPCHTLGVPGFSLLEETPWHRGLHFLFQAASSSSLCWVLCWHLHHCAQHRREIRSKKTHSYRDPDLSAPTERLGSPATLGHIPLMLFLKLFDRWTGLLSAPSSVTSLSLWVWHILAKQLEPC